MSDSEPITPALTPEEWGVAGKYAPEPPHIDRRSAWGAMLDADGVSIGSTFDNAKGRHAPLRDGERHALAALCLYGQRFGFTPEDVAELQDLAKSWEEEAAMSDEYAKGTAWRSEDWGIWGKNAESCRARAAKARSIASRIAALLPAPTPAGDSP